MHSSSTLLTLVDGGEDLQNIPFESLRQALRQVNVILALDSSADTSTRWPNGMSMVATYKGSLNSLRHSTCLNFPPVPDQNTFIKLGLNSQPTFFGCNSPNVTGSAPLVVYIPIAPYIYLHTCPMSPHLTFNTILANLTPSLRIATTLQLSEIQLLTLTGHLV